MKRLIAITIVLLVSSINSAFAQAEYPSPKNGQSYPPGTTLQAVCNLALAHEISTWTDFQWWDASRGGWNSFTPAIQQGTCQARFNTPGNYRMVVITGSFGNPDEVSIVAEFKISEPTPCDNKANQIIVIKDGNDEITIETKVLGHDSYAKGVKMIIEAALINSLENKRYTVLDLIANNML